MAVEQRLERIFCWRFVGGGSDGFTEEQLKLGLEERVGKLFVLAWATPSLQRRISYIVLSQVLSLCG